jgi:hypothetical protein
MQITHDWQRETRDTSQAAGTRVLDEGIASSGFTFQLWRLYQHAWLVCLCFPLVSLVREPVSTFRVALGLFALFFFAASYTWLMWPHPASQGMRARSRSRLALALLVVLILEVTAFSLVYGPSFLWLYIGVSAIAGRLLSHCLTKNLPLSSSQNHSSRSIFHLCTKITSSLMLLGTTNGSGYHMFTEADFS